MLTYIAIHIYSRKYGNFLYLTRATTVPSCYINIGTQPAEICEVWVYLGEDFEMSDDVY